MKKIKLILPDDNIIPDFKDKSSMYFLSGTINENDDWRTKAIKMIDEQDKNCYIVCPSKLSEISWKKRYMNSASFFGSIIFYFSCKDEKKFHKKDYVSYMISTYMDLASWSIKAKHPDIFRFHSTEIYSGRFCGVNIVVGVEENFSELNNIKERLNTEHLNQFPIYSSLEETVSEAVKLAKRTKPELKRIGSNY